MPTDDFNRAAGGLGANWTTLEGTPVIDGTNTRVAGVGAFTNHSAFYSGAAFAPDHYSQILSLGGASAGEGPLVRCAAGPAGYIILATASSINLYGYGLGGLQDYGSTVTAGDRLRCEMAGPNLILKKNDTPIGITQVDTTYPTGAPGIFVYGDASILDDFVGESLTRPGLNPLTGWM